MAVYLFQCILYFYIHNQRIYQNTVPKDLIFSFNQLLSSSNHEINFWYFVFKYGESYIDSIDNYRRRLCYQIIQFMYIVVSTYRYTYISYKNIFLNVLKKLRVIYIYITFFLLL